ncbi:PWWP domain-containing protein 3-like [Lotus japonicus]|uniref:PWWP domain-containing protein 3-like n=1 Tax=Lotus japonicus TaxID=34305 RepID=UPI00258315DC|nr:PWWP domain-containing protein 3-like [Lotus japonicus]
MTRSKAPSGCSSPCPENDKNELREALCALKSGILENGAGGQVFGDGGVVEVVKRRVFDAKVSVQRDLMEREFVDGCHGLAASEMNGVSSLLKMRSSRNLMFTHGGESDGAWKLNSGGGGSFGVGMRGGREDCRRSEDEADQDGEVVTIDVPIADSCQNKDLEMEYSGDEGYEFSVGDFVWGKIKSHPWWPGRIYDPSDASDFALKLRQKNRLLVAYFGDGTFAWCRPSQLKPFRENFDDMVRQNSSRAFVNAVQEAANEVGRLLDSKMSYLSVARETRSGCTRSLASNAGIKEGVHIPENGVGRLSDVLIDPAELLTGVKQIAKIISISSILNLEILKARLSAFNLSRGGCKLPSYEVPQPIPGLEDKETVGVVTSSKCVVEAPAQGPFEDDYFILPGSPKSGELDHSHGIPRKRLNHRIKQKSIAEILGADKDVNTKNKEGNATEDSVASKPVQKRKGLPTSTDINMASAKNDGSDGKEESSDKETLSQLKKKKKSCNENVSSGSKKQTDEEGKSKEQNEKSSMSRGMKKSKYLSPSFAIPTRDQRKEDKETESPKVSVKAQISQPVTSDSEQLSKSPVLLNSNGETFQENSSKELAIEHDLPDSTNYRTPEGDENKTIDTTKVQVTSWDVLTEVRYAAMSPLTLRDINSLEKLVDFIFIYRSSLYREGSYYKIYKKHQPGKKRKKPEPDLGILSEDQNQTDHKSPINDSVPKKRRMKNMTTSGMAEEKQAAVAKTVRKGTSENSSAAAAALFISFGLGTSLPSKADLITLYSKFGALNESETAMLSTIYTGRVFFLKASDAEKALSHSQNTNPFGSSKVSFRLQYHPAGSNSVANGEISKIKASSTKKKDKTPAKPSSSLSPGSEASKLNYIKQKLQGLTSMLEASDFKSLDTKAKLESEMKGLLQDVSKMVESSSS